jgi:hypothetical protein
MEYAAGGAQPPSAEERSAGELVKLLSDQVSKLVHDELKLAQLEMTRTGKQAGVGTGMLGCSALPPVPEEAGVGGRAAEGTRKLTGVWPGDEGQPSGREI